MEIYLGNELGNLCVDDCKSIKTIMDDATFYKFKVSWSNYAGNCQLIVKTDYPAESEDEVKRMFISAYFTKSAGIAKFNEILINYLRSKQEHPERVVMFKDEHDYKFYLDDAAVIKQMSFPEYRSFAGKTKQGINFAMVDKSETESLMSQLNTIGKEVCVFDI